MNPHILSCGKRQFYTTYQSKASSRENEFMTHFYYGYQMSTVISGHIIKTYHRLYPAYYGKLAVSSKYRRYVMLEYRPSL